MSEAELRGMAAQVANMIRTALTNKQPVGLLIAVNRDGETRRLRTIEKEIEDRLGQDWLNDGPKKDAAFDVLYHTFQIAQPDAVAFGALTNIFKGTPKLYALPKDKLLAIVNGAPWDGVRDGYLEPHNALTVTVQSPELACLYSQEFPEGSVDFSAEPTIEVQSQSKFAGRQKMYGPQDIESFHETVAKKKREHRDA